MSRPRNISEIWASKQTNPEAKAALEKESKGNWNAKEQGGFLNGFTQTISEGVDLAKGLFGIPTGSEKEAQQRMMNDQIKAYREQTELTRQELNTKKDETNYQKRRIQEKQIRTLRRSTRASNGFLGSSSSGDKDMSNKLGG